jgi:uncharacterized protein (DUF1330 family)
MEKMKKPLFTLGIALSLAAAACTPKPQGEKKPAPDYQMSITRFQPPNVQNICYDEPSMTAYYVRMVQQEMAVGTLSCIDAKGNRMFTQQYTDTLNKFGGDLSANASDMKALMTKKRLNFDVVITEFANREAQRRHDDPEYCPRMARAFAWALSPDVKTLAQVPPPHDLGPEMNAFPCPK